MPDRVTSEPFLDHLATETGGTERGQPPGTLVLRPGAWRTHFGTRVDTDIPILISREPVPAQPGDRAPVCGLSGKAERVDHYPRCDLRALNHNPPLSSAYRSTCTPGRAIQTALFRQGRICTPFAQPGDPVHTPLDLAASVERQQVERPAYGAGWTVDDRLLGKDACTSISP
jgi:hypothetical protein